jgi:hypothetical protein
MGRAKKHAELIQGHAVHRRTEGDYMGVLLDAVTLDDWRDVVSTTKAAAKAGDPQARAWLAQYLMGKPTGTAPTPLTVVVGQLQGTDALIERLAKPFIDRQKYPSLHAYDSMEAEIRALVTAELRKKVDAVETIENSAAARVCGPSATE